jgi:hypothetical protein
MSSEILGNRPGGNFHNVENVRKFCLIPGNNRPDGVIYPHISEALLIASLKSLIISTSKFLQSVFNILCDARERIITRKRKKIQHHLRWDEVAGVEAMVPLCLTSHY